VSRGNQPPWIRWYLRWLADALDPWPEPGQMMCVGCALSRADVTLPADQIRSHSEQHAQFDPHAQIRIRVLTRTDAPASEGESSDGTRKR
jgi:hypothetical protein